MVHTDKTKAKFSVQKEPVMPQLKLLSARCTSGYCCVVLCCLSQSLTYLFFGLQNHKMENSSFIPEVRSGFSAASAGLCCLVISLSFALLHTVYSRRWTCLDYFFYTATQDEHTYSRRTHTSLVACQSCVLFLSAQHIRLQLASSSCSGVHFCCDTQHPHLAEVL